MYFFEPGIGRFKSYEKLMVLINTIELWRIMKN